jgi:hypothetical protein
VHGSYSVDTFLACVADGQPVAKHLKAGETKEAQVNFRLTLPLHNILLRDEI